MIEIATTALKEAAKEKAKDVFLNEVNKQMTPKELLSKSENNGISGNDKEINSILKEASSGIKRETVDTESENEKIQEKSTFSKTINECITTYEELKIYIEADLEEVMVGDKPALIRNDIDLEQIDEATGETNLERMQKGKPPLDKDGKPIELHHVGQKSDGPLAELTQEEHRGKGNDGVLHDKTQDSEIDRKEFAKERAEHWKARAEAILQEQGE